VAGDNSGWCLWGILAGEQFGCTIEGEEDAVLSAGEAWASV
jgi:hypothetical protein